MASLVRPNAKKGSILSNGQLTVSLDGDARREFRRSKELIDYPVEEGSDASDHEVLKQPDYKIVGIVTDTPTIGQDPNPEPLRSLSALQSLQLMQDSNLPISLVSPGVTDNGLVLVELGHIEDNTSGHAAKVELTLRKKLIKQTQGIVLSNTSPVSQAGRRPTLTPEQIEIDAAQSQFNNWVNAGWRPPR